MELLQHRDYNIEILRRPYQRSIGVNVKPSGTIRVTVSRTASMGSITRFLDESEDWIEKVLGEYRDVRQKFPPKRYMQGEGFLYRGQMVYFNYEMSVNKKMDFVVDGSHLFCFVPMNEWTPAYHTFPQPQVKDEIVKFYKREGTAALEAAVKKYSRLMGLYPTGVSYRSQKTRWGSCSSEGRVSLNWRLIAAPPEVLEYVVIHELAHLKHQNHSQKFWNLVEQFAPLRKENSKWLRRHHFDFDFLAKDSELYPINNSQNQIPLKSLGI